MTTPLERDRLEAQELLKECDFQPCYCDFLENYICQSCRIKSLFIKALQNARKETRGEDAKLLEDCNAGYCCGNCDKHAQAIRKLATEEK